MFYSILITKCEARALTITILIAWSCHWSNLRIPLKIWILTHYSWLKSLIKSIYIQGVPQKKTKCASISLKYTMMKLFIFNNFNNVSKILTKKEKKKIQDACTNNNFACSRIWREFFSHLKHHRQLQIMHAWSTNNK